MSTAPTVTLDNRFARDLPEMAVPWQAEAVAEPLLLVLDEDLAGELGFDPAWLRGPDGVRLLTGAAGLNGATPVAQAYSGHQFGGFSRGSATAGRCCSARSRPAAGSATCT
ncbi:hypothetical protein OHA72_49340 [Dactylosporangium sp. NBC_01737]|uniref:hypothetical protein n=1 Tax=Dactylosporangium sp. NBC_01737 TaxID=2975959 RepID=UPI002E13E41F|nr:hypothetical protein OHA72_49340 [Dactylosporangium sp. NBC_01737]